MSNKVAKRKNGEPTLVEIRLDAVAYPRIHRIPKNQSELRMMQIVARAYAYKGQTMDENNIRFVAATLLEELLRDEFKVGTRNLTFEEIERVVRRYILTEDTYGVSVAGLYKALNDYATGEGLQAHEQACRMAGTLGMSTALRTAIDNGASALVKKYKA